MGESADNVPVRVGKNNENSQGDLLSILQLMPSSANTSTQPIKTMISKKLLNQAKNNQAAKSMRKNGISGKHVSISSRPAMQTYTSRRATKSQFDFNPKKLNQNSSIENSKRMYNSQLSKTNQSNNKKKTKKNVLEQAKQNNTFIRSPKRTHTEIKKHSKVDGKENYFSNNMSQERSFTNNMNQTVHQPIRNNGMSISSFNSSNSARQTQKQKSQQRNGSIAQQLSKTYFLNTKQLLRHLSPGRGKSQIEQNMVAQQHSTISIDEGLQSRGRSKSSVNNTSGIQTAQQKQRRTSSHSNPRGQSYSQTMHKTLSRGKLNDKKPASQMDKLIKKNIKKNNKELEENEIRKLMHYEMQKKRSVDQRQRNQEVRMLNASKANKQPEQSLIVGEGSDQDKRRAKSCIRFNDRNHSLDATTQSKLAAPPPSTQMLQKPFQKQMPMTTKQNKAKTFVNELAELTHQVEKELGSGHVTQKAKKANKLSGQQNKDLMLEMKKPKNDHLSVKLQNFIEKKHRKENIKKGMERTIEYEKSKQIKQNLMNLDQFVKKHMRQKSQPIILSKPSKTIVGGQLLAKNMRKTHKKRPTQPVVGIGLSEIFYPGFTKDSLTQDLAGLKDHSETVVVSSVRNKPHMPKDSSLIIDPNLLFQDLTAGRSTSKAKPISGKRRKSKGKIRNNNRSSGSGTIQNAVPNKKTLQPQKQVSVPLPSGHYRQSAWLEQKHPINQNRLAQTSKVSEPVSQMRRVHELVALYRHKYKANLSDAKIMANLHAAACVIQFHFRYGKPLRKHIQEQRVIPPIQKVQILVKQKSPKKQRTESQQMPKQQVNEILQKHSQIRPVSTKVKARNLSLNIKVTENEKIIDKSPQTGSKTPQIPGLDLNKIKENQQKSNKKDEEKQKKVKIEVEAEAQPTISSYRMIFSNLGLPLKRSARVVVDYKIVVQDPKMAQEVKTIVNKKNEMGQQVIEEGFKNNLISERTYKINKTNLEKWVTASYQKIENNQRSKSHQPKTNDQLIQETDAGKLRLKQTLIEGTESGRGHLSWRDRGKAPGDTTSQYQSGREQSNAGDPFTDRDPYGNSIAVVKPIGSSREEKSKLIELIGGDTSRTSSKRRDPYSDSEDKIQSKADVSFNSYGQLQLKGRDVNDEDIVIDEVCVQNLGSNSGSEEKNEKSLNRTTSYPTIKKDGGLESLHEASDEHEGIANHEDIDFQLEEALKQQQDKNGEDDKMKGLHGERFFMSKIEEDSLGDTHEKLKNLQVNDPTSAPPPLEDQEGTQVDYDAIKVENQKEQQVRAANKNLIPHPNSPLSEGQAFEFSKIQTGAHSLSSTDSDMAKVIAAANKDALDSPPNLISPKAGTMPLLTVIDQSDSNHQLADDMADYILRSMLQDIAEEIPLLVARPELLEARPQMPKFFEKKGIKTDLFAIEKYVDEIIEEVKLNRQDFMVEIIKPIAQNPLEGLFEMQNSGIGSYDHFQSHYSPVLSLDLYLKLEKRRKESRENGSAAQDPDGLFDFDISSEEDLKKDGVNKNFLAECQHIHNKVLFDCINDSLQQFRPHGKDGAPQIWSTLGRKLKPTDDFQLEEIFEITKHDLFRMAIMQAGTLPRREFVFNHNFDHELFGEIREKKLSTLLCREIVEIEPSWLKWDFEEAQTKIDIGDMVLEALVTETIQFLQTKNQMQSPAQRNFEELQQMMINN